MTYVPPGSTAPWLLLMDPPTAQRFAADYHISFERASQPPWLEATLELPPPGNLDHPSPDSFWELFRRIVLDGGTVIAAPRSFVPQALFMDLDSTLIHQEGIDLLAEHVGQSRAVAAITAEAMAGRLEFAQALAARLLLLRGLAAGPSLSKSAEQLTLQNGAIELAAECRRRKISLFIISGGIKFFADYIGQQLGGVSQVHAHQLQTDHQGNLTGQIQGSLIDGPAKAAWLAEMAKKYEISIDCTLATGDGANDRWLLAAAGVGVGFSPKKLLLQHLLAANHSKSHQMLLALLRTLTAP